MIEIRMVRGTQEEMVRIPEIPEEELSSYELIGTAEGMDKFHCHYLARKFAENFEDRVAGYRYATPKMKGAAMAISFYEKPVAKENT